MTDPISNGPHISGVDPESVEPTGETAVQKGALDGRTVTVKNFPEIEEALSESADEFDELLKMLDEAEIAGELNVENNEEKPDAKDPMQELSDLVENGEVKSEITTEVARNLNNPKKTKEREAFIEANLKQAQQVSIEADEKADKAQEKERVKIENSDMPEKKKKNLLSALKTAKVGGLALIALGIVVTVASVAATFGPAGPAGAVGVLIGVSMIYTGMFLTTYGMASEEMDANEAQNQKFQEIYDSDFKNSSFPDFLKAYDNKWDEDVKNSLAKDIKSFIKDNRNYYDENYELKNKDMADHIDKVWENRKEEHAGPKSLFPNRPEEPKISGGHDAAQWDRYDAATNMDDRPNTQQL